MHNKYKYGNFTIDGVPCNREAVMGLTHQQLYRIFHAEIASQKAIIGGKLVTWKVHEITHIYETDGRVFNEIEDVYNYIQDQTSTRRAYIRKPWHDDVAVYLGYRIAKSIKLKQIKPWSDKLRTISSEKRSYTMNEVATVYIPYDLGGVVVVLKKYKSTGELIKTLGWSQGAKFVKA
jgi:hypothetical protein